MSAIAQTKEKYMALTARVPVDKTKEDKRVYFDIKLMDSYQFMTSSLAVLAGNLESVPIAQSLKGKYASLTGDIIRR